LVQYFLSLIGDNAPRNDIEIECRNFASLFGQIPHAAIRFEQ